jgi:hypothetical protein
MGEASGEDNSLTARIKVAAHYRSPVLSLLFTGAAPGKPTTPMTAHTWQ